MSVKESIPLTPFLYKRKGEDLVRGAGAPLRRLLPFGGWGKESVAQIVVQPLSKTSFEFVGVVE